MSRPCIAHLILFVLLAAPALAQLEKKTVEFTEPARPFSVDLSKVDVTRTHWPFLRDRRIDAYDGLTKRLID